MSELERFRSGLRVSIAETSTRTGDDGTKYTMFYLHIQTMYGTFEVSRRYRQFDALNLELTQQASHMNLPPFPKKRTLGNLATEFVEERRLALEDYLRGVLNINGVMRLEPLVRFLELSLPLQMAIMATDINTAFNEIKNNSVAMQELVQRISVLEATASQHGSRSSSRQNSATEQSQNSLGMSEHKKISESSEEVASPKHGYFIAQVLGVEQEMTPGSGIALTTDGAGRDTFRSPDSHDPRQLSYLDGSISTPGTDASTSIPDELQDIVQLVDDAVFRQGEDSGPSQWDTLADEVVFMMQPQEPQIHYRRSASKYIARHTRKTLSAQTYEIGLQALRCFLPDDPIRMSVFLSRNEETGWYVRLNERMCRLSGGINKADGGGDVSYSLSNVSFISNETFGHKLQCLVDSSLGVEVLANVRLELCIVAFMEEFDRILGKDHLLKRSVILLRTWWIYEANMSSSCGISDSAFCTMIMSILNRHHKKIVHPFQTLCLFLAEFSTLDFAASVVTIYGPVPRDSYMKSDPSLNTSDCLVSTHLLNKYRKLTLAVDDDESSTMELLSETIGDNSLSDANFVTNRLLSNGKTAPTVCPFDVKPIMIAHPLLPGMLFDGPTPIRQRKTGIIFESFRNGAKDLLPMLKVQADDQSVNRHTLMDVFFKNSTARFGRGWRPDTPASSSIYRPADAWGGPQRGSSDRFSDDSSTPFQSIELSRENSLNRTDLNVEVSPLSMSLEKMWQRIMYCNLILEAQISDSALNTLSKLVLLEGPLPVGEIGKMLQEACSVVSNMSSVLKERFGGLKKFLERFPEAFVLANDHPFNPNVYLIESLSIEEHAAILRGESLVRQSTTSQSSGGSKRRQRNNSRNNITNNNIIRKKSPQPNFVLGNDYASIVSKQQQTSGGGGTRNTVGRTQSSNSLHENGLSGNVFQPRMSLDALPSEIGHLGDWENRMRLNANNSVTDSRSTLGQMGLPDPAAPEFVPTWNQRA